jgi:hypothetical protein
MEAKKKYRSSNCDDAAISSSPALRNEATDTQDFSNILIIKANEIHYFSDLFGKELYTF